MQVPVPSFFILFLFLLFVFTICQEKYWIQRDRNVRFQCYIIFLCLACKGTSDFLLKPDSLSRIHFGAIEYLFTKKPDNSAIIYSWIMATYTSLPSSISFAIVIMRLAQARTWIHMTLIIKAYEIRFSFSD